MSLILAILAALSPAPPQDWIAYVGTYTQGASKGIYAYRFQSATGKATPIGLVAESSNPSYLALAPNGRFLYAVNEDNAGGVSAYAVEAGGKLKLLNHVSSHGSGPCHLAVDKTGNWLFVANYNNGISAAFPVHADGSVGDAATVNQDKGTGPNHERQEGPHAHATTLSPDNHFVLVADLGIDQILEYRVDAAKGMVPNTPPFVKTAPGAGPRHLAFGADGKFLYAVNELASTVTVFRYEAKDGALSEVQTLSTLPTNFKGNNSTAEIAVHPNGKFLYASNRGHDSIATFRIDTAKGTLTALDRIATKGKTPRNFAIDPSGAFLLAANQNTGNIVIFKIDANSGALTATGDVLDVPFPVSIVFAKAP